MENDAKKLQPCRCGYAGALTGMDTGTHLILSCPVCNSAVTAFTMHGLAERWNIKAELAELKK